MGSKRKNVFDPPPNDARTGSRCGRRRSAGYRSWFRNAEVESRYEA